MTRHRSDRSWIGISSGRPVLFYFISFVCLSFQHNLNGMQLKQKALKWSVINARKLGHEGVCSMDVWVCHVSNAQPPLNPNWLYILPISSTSLSIWKMGGHNLDPSPGSMPFASLVHVVSLVGSMTFPWVPRCAYCGALYLLFLTIESHITGSPLQTMPAVKPSVDLDLRMT